jgi:hypothetical protein
LRASHAPVRTIRAYALLRFTGAIAKRAEIKRPTCISVLNEAAGKHADESLKVPSHARERVHPSQEPSEDGQTSQEIEPETRPFVGDLANECKNRWEEIANSKYKASG